MSNKFGTDRKKISKEVKGLFNNAGIPNSNTPPAPTWEDLNKLYTEVGVSIIEVTQQINNAIDYVNQFVNYQKNDEFKLTINSLNNDINDISKRLVEIKNIHENKSGIVTTEDYKHYMDVYILYQDVFEKFRAVVFPNMLTLSEYMTEAQIQYKKEIGDEDINNTEGKEDGKKD